MSTTFAFPEPPARRESDTSAGAAKAIGGSAGFYRKKVLQAFRQAGDAGLTADQAAELAGLSILTARPRVTELNKAGLIVDTGDRRRNASGRRAVVWRVVEGACL